uniref:ARAD1B09790p n=1 Tax=Blastobotrys adeninivorans TaxID=409370 RepID=A0A060T5C1_BLAAD
MSRTVEYMATADAYDRWAEVYDTDSNFLQKLDDREMNQWLVPELSKLLRDKSDKQADTLKLLDLGCGTGRNTLKLVSAFPTAEIVGLELSSKMLEIANERCGSGKKIVFQTYDLLKDSVPEEALNCDAVISTLVLEHVPIKDFLTRALEACKPGSYLVVTNMHSDMGAISQAGFVCPNTGVKIRPTSYSHTTSDFVTAAKECGFRLVSELKEQGVTEKDTHELGPRSGKWVGVTVWFGCILQRT